MGALDDGTLDQAQQLGLRPMIWSPLGGGRLFNGDDEQALRVRAEMDAIATRLGNGNVSEGIRKALKHFAE